MKRKVLCLLSVLMILCLTACGSQTTTNSNQENTVSAPESNDVTNNSNSVTNGNTVTAATPAVSADKVEIVKEYAIRPNKYSSYTYHIIVVKNNNDLPANIKSNTKVFDKDGNMIGADGGSLDVLGPGYTSVIVEAIDDVDNYDKFESTLAVTESKYYGDVESMLAMELNATSNKVFVTLTNNGEKPAEFVEAYVFFLDSEGNIVDYDRKYMNVNDSEIKPGESVTEEFKTDEAFANAEVYLDGRSEKD